ncbi:MAG: hypothetical protein MI749_00735 [Desulfovibrionales bacterium]|nr:hypothetical protein [Desulfovibrionales bacterium]
MKKSFRSFILFITCSCLSLNAVARWQTDSFTSGELKHHIASAETGKYGTEFELFCSNFDSRISATLYLPQQRYLNRETIKVHMRVDKEKLWTFYGTRHSMAVVIPNIPSQLLTQLSRGNRVIITFPVSGTKKQTEQYALKNSAKTVTSLTSQCRT